jgi:hypothetical protein
MPACRRPEDHGTYGERGEVQTTSRDTRRLGVNLSRLVLKSGYVAVTVEHNHPLLIDGFYEAEAAHRWTDGNASIAPEFFACFTQDFTIEVHVVNHSLPYRTDPLYGLESDVDVIDRVRLRRAG